MEHHVYKKIEIVGTAESSVEDAIANGVERAAKTLHSTSIGLKCRKSAARCAAARWRNIRW